MAFLVIACSERDFIPTIALFHLEVAFVLQE